MEVVMARKEQQIVWTKYLSERTLLKAWHILENNYFKSAIKKARDNGGVVSYAVAHNALYAGLYFPDEKFMTSDKPLAMIKQELGLKKYITISNVLPPHQVLKNIHAMHVAGKSILDNMQKIQQNDGYTYALCNYAGRQIHDENIDAKKVNRDKKSLEPVQPNCYRYVKKIKRDLALGKPIGTVFDEGDKSKQQKFDIALKKYQDAFKKFENELQNHGVLAGDSQKTCFAQLDNGLYCTMLGNVGFDITELLQKQNPNAYVSRKELELHTKKLLTATKTLQKTNAISFNELKKILLGCGEQMRKDFVLTNKTYPECAKGFYNALANVLSKNLQYINVFDESQTKNYPSELKEILQKISKLEQTFKSSNAEEKQKASEKLEKIAHILE